MNGYRYRVYRNLRDNDYTIQHHVPGKGWRKLKGATMVVADDCAFKVYEAGRKRVLQQGVKNVHAYILANHVTVPGEPQFPGRWDDSFWGDIENDGWNIRYNPYFYDWFCTDLHQDVEAADTVLCDRGGKLTALYPSFKKEDMFVDA